jgi:hypothetical protein
MQQKTEKLNIVTTAGMLKQVTLEEFIAEIPVETCYNLIEQYNTCLSHGDSENINVPDSELPNNDDSTYTRDFVILTENSLQHQLMHILDQVQFATIEGKDQLDKIENAAVTSLENFGAPTHLVEITRNCYAVFCMEDFKRKLISPTLGAIICYAPNRNLIFRASW